MSSNEQQKHEYVGPKQTQVLSKTTGQHAKTLNQLYKRDFPVNLVRGTRPVYMELMDWYRYGSLSAADARTGSEQPFHCLFCFYKRSLILSDIIKEVTWEGLICIFVQFDHSEEKAFLSFL